MERDLWTHRDETIGDIDLVGFSVEAVDGSIGKIDEATYDLGDSYLVVDTGPWIFGKKVILPAGVIDSIDLEDERVWLRRTRDEVKHAPPYRHEVDAAYREELTTHYAERTPTSMRDV